MDKDDLFNDYLNEYHGDEIHTKDQLIEAQENMYLWEQFARHFLTKMTYEGKISSTTIVTQDMIDKFLEDI